MKQKKGISLIVLVVTIIVMIIVAGAIIISLNNTNVLDMGEQAVQKHNIESIEEAINLAYQDELVASLGKINEQNFAKRLEELSNTYTEIQEITPGNGKVYYTLSLTGEDYLISTQTGEIAEYVDNYEEVIDYETLWTRSGTTITGYKGTGEQLKNVIVPNILKDSNGNETKITNISLKGIDFQGTLTISSGLIINVQSFQNCNNIQKVIIGDNVKILGNIGVGDAGSFRNCSSLTEVRMGKNIKIEDAPAGGCWPFINCSSLETVTVESLSQVGGRAFWGVGKALKGTVIINEGVTNIGNHAFKDCENVENILMPNTIKTIDHNAFNGCKRAKINYPENVKSIGDSAFKNCKNMTIDLKLKTGTTISNNSFNGAGIKNLEIGEGITLYGYSFYACENLEKVVIKDNVTFTSEAYLFGKCPVLKTVEMGKNIKIGDGNIGDAWPFVNCSSLETVTVESLSQVGSRAFRGAAKALKGTIVINEEVTTIGGDAFKGCENAENIVLPSTITTIGGSAFINCKTAKINYPENVKSIGDSAFKNCKNMTIDLKLKTGTTISNNSFNGAGIKNLEIGEGITLYGYSFYACENLEKVVIKDNVTFTSEAYLFGKCPVLKAVEMGKNIKIGDGNIGDAWPFVNCSSLETVTVGSLSQVGSRAFRGVGKALKGTVKINEGVTVIGGDAFMACENVENIVMPSTITTIGGRAFYNCKGLKSLSINMTEEQFANVTKGSSWNTNVPVSVTCLVEAAE